jgi:hypothetical protein
MAITRTIYTQGTLIINSGTLGDNWAVLSGVQNASYSLNTPRENVSQFSAKGLIDKVQVAPTEASITCSFIIPNALTADLGYHIPAVKLNGLMQNAQLTDTLPNMIVTAGGLGRISGAVLSSVNVNAAVGDLPTMELTFDGVPTSNPIDTDSEVDGTKLSPVPIATAFTVVTPAFVSGFAGGNKIDLSTGDSSSDAIQTFTFGWEMPVERIQRLGENVNATQPFGNPPGTATITLEGTNIPGIAGLSGIAIGPYIFAIGGRSDVVSREHSMAVGDVSATFSVNIEGTADAVICSVSAS